jgi:TRAP transporter 4TM/12TM fusion protein
VSIKSAIPRLFSQRSLRGKTANVVAAVAIACSVYHIWCLATGIPEALRFRPIHVVFALSLAFSLYPATKKSPRDHIPLYDIFWIVAVVASIIYLHVDFERIAWRYGFISPVTMLDIIFGTILIIAVTEAVRRTTGIALAALTGLVLIYTLMGQRLPGIFRHTSVPFTHVIDQSYLLPAGIFGSVTQISATMVMAFVLFGAFLIAVRGSDFLMNLASLLTHNLRAGVAKASIVGSAFFGMISGSAVSNVYGTGTVTIPLMKKAGFQPHVAGGVEAASSTVGQWMPPVMGSAAFLIAMFAETTYLRVMKASFIPAILFTTSIFFSVHFYALKNGIGKYEFPSMEPLRKTLLDFGHLFIPIIALVTLLVLNYTPYYCAMVTMGIIVLVSLFRRNTRLNFRRIFNTLESAAYKLTPTATALICASMVVGLFDLTGVHLRFSALIINITGAQLAPTLILIMVTSIILGMGLPTAACYVITMVFGVPALIAAGVGRLAAHMFIFYFATLSTITPPVCLSSYAAASLAESNPIKTGLAGVRLAIAAYLMPFAVIFCPALIMEGSLPQIVAGFFTGIAGAMCLAAAVQGRFFIGEVSIIERVLLVGAAILLIQTNVMWSLLGVVCAGAVHGFQRKRFQKSADHK